MGRLGTMLIGGYLALAACSVAYELSVRIYDTGNSEFAGMLSTVLTLPSSLLLITASKAIVGVNVGDSNAAFVTILGLSAVANTCALAMIVALVRRAQ